MNDIGWRLKTKMKGVQIPIHGWIRHEVKPKPKTTQKKGGWGGGVMDWNEVTKI